MNWIDQSIDSHAKLLALRSARSETLAGNIANAATPGFKARDIDIGAEFRSFLNQADGNLAQTRPGHMAGFTGTDANLMYRVPAREGENGNTVEQETELAAFTQNAIQYQAGLQFLSSKISGLKLALKGE